MPGGNQMGPMGQGPMTGRGMGRCGGANAADSTRPEEPGLGVRHGRGRGFQSGVEQGRHGRRHRNRHHASGVCGWQRAEMGSLAVQGSFSGPSDPAINKEHELEVLKQQTAYFESALKDLR